MQILSATPPGDIHSAGSDDRQAWSFVADWLSGLFLKPPDSNAIQTCVADSMIVFLTSLGEQIGCQGICQSIADRLLQATPEVLARELERSYTTLFEGVTGPRTVPLYESAYMGDGARLFQKPTAEMQALLGHLDLSIAAEVYEPADHVSIELAVLSKALAAGDAPTKEELRKRLLTWAPKLSGRIAYYDSEGFYAAVSVVLVSFLSAMPAVRSSEPQDQRL